MELQQMIFRTRLSDLFSEPSNQICSECTNEYPEWASIIIPPHKAPPGSKKLGVFCCEDCSASHRRLGRNICVVRSIVFDKWEEDDVVAMEMGGNKKVNGIFEANLSAQAKKLDQEAGRETRDKFVREKYLFLKFYDVELYEQHSKQPEVYDSVMGKLQQMRALKKDESVASAVELMFAKEDTEIKSVVENDSFHETSKLNQQSQHIKRRSLRKSHSIRMPSQGSKKLANAGEEILCISDDVPPRRTTRAKSMDNDLVVASNSRHDTRPRRKNVIRHVDRSSQNHEDAELLRKNLLKSTSFSRRKVARQEKSSSTHQTRSSLEKLTTNSIENPKPRQGKRVHRSRSCHQEVERARVVDEEAPSTIARGAVSVGVYNLSNKTKYLVADGGQRYVTAFQKIAMKEERKAAMAA